MLFIDRHDFSYLLLCHLLADHPVSLHIVDRRWWKLCLNLPQREVCRPHAVCGVIGIVLLCPNLHTWFLSSIQVFFRKTFTMPWSWYFLVWCLISLLMCVVLNVINFIPSFISQAKLAHLSPITCKPPFMFLHLRFYYPSSYSISHAIIKSRMTILKDFFPCLVTAARVFPAEDWRPWLLDSSDGTTLCLPMDLK